MRTMFFLLAVLIAGCATRQHLNVTPFSSNAMTSEEAAGTCRNPLPIAAFSAAAGSATEMAFVTARYPGATKVTRTDARCSGKPADRIRFRDAEGKKITLYFDKSRWTR